MRGQEDQGARSCAAACLLPQKLTCRCSVTDYIPHAVLVKAKPLSARTERRNAGWLLDPDPSLAADIDFTGSGDTMDKM
jgi:hypothetical protein